MLIIFWWYLLTAKLTGSRMKLVEIKSLISVYPFSIPGKFHLGTPQFFCQQVPSFIVWRSRSMYSIVVHIGKNSLCISHCSNLTYRHIILPIGNENVTTHHVFNFVVTFFYLGYRLQKCDKSQLSSEWDNQKFSYIYTVYYQRNKWKPMKCRLFCSDLL